MKRYLLSAFAIIAAISMTAFTTAGSKTVKAKDSLHWFEISGTLAENEAVPRNNTLTYYGESEEPPNIGCTGSEFQCMSGFTDTQVSGNELIDDSQVPEWVAGKKNN
jgi:hypothetical protein